MNIQSFQRIPLIIFCCFLIFSCSEEKKEQGDNHEEKIEQVENGLTYPVVIKGDTPFNIRERMVHYGVPGLSIAVIHDFEIVWVKSYGVMDSTTMEEVSNETLFQAGSISKPVAAMGALKAVMDGKIELENPINDYLSSWKVPENEFNQEEKVTLGRILSHTAGLTVHGFLGYTIHQDVPSLVQILDGEAPANSPAIRVFREPGIDYKYSGGGFTIMQQMMIDQYGKSYPEIQQDLVLGPLGMTHSTYEQPLPPEKLQKAAAGYLPNRTMTTGKRHTYPEMAAAGLWTTAEDLAKFALDLQLCIQGKECKVLSQEWADQMTNAYFDDYVGLGIFLDIRGGEIHFQHGGWDEGFTANMIAHREKGYGLVILTNANKPPFNQELTRAVARAYEWDKFMPEDFEAIPLSQEEITELCGRYKYDNSELITVFEEEGKIYMKYLFEDPMEITKISETDFTRRERTSRIRFVENAEDGKSYFAFPNDEGEVELNHPKLGEDEILPIEHLIAGNYDKAEEDILALQQEDPDESGIDEGRLNNLGYELLYDNKIDLAISVFKINVALYPESSNTYDSLGEAYMENGEDELAIKYYRISLDMDPENNNAREMLKKLGAS